MGKIWQYSAVDGACSFGFAKVLAGEKSAASAGAFLEREVAPVYAEAGIALGEAVVDGGPELTGEFTKLASPRRRPGLSPAATSSARRRTPGRQLCVAVHSSWAREQLESGAGASQRARPILVTYTWLSVHADRETAIERVRPMLASMPSGLAEPSVRQHLLPLSFSSEVLSVLERAKDEQSLARELKPNWIRELAVVGTPEDCADEVRRRSDAGADRVVLVPLPDKFDEQVRLFSDEVLPLLA